MYDVLLILHFIGLALGVGASLANFTLGLATRDMEPAARTQFFLRAFALGKNGSYGLLLLLVSGIGMLLSRGVKATFVWGGPAFHAKLTLVVILLGLFGYQQVLVKRAKQAQGGPTMATIPKLGRAMLLVSIGIVITAVLAFH